MSEEMLILMDRLDDVFAMAKAHNWDLPLWIRRELMLVYSQYRRVNSTLGVKSE